MSQDSRDTANVQDEQSLPCDGSDGIYYMDKLRKLKNSDQRIYVIFNHLEIVPLTSICETFFYV